MPSPYRGLVYADPAQTWENSTKLVQEQSQTVYAKIDHVKTASVKISPQNLKETKEGEHKWALPVYNPRNDLAKKT